MTIVCGMDQIAHEWIACQGTKAFRSLFHAIIPLFGLFEKKPLQLIRI